MVIMTIIIVIIQIYCKYNNILYRIAWSTLTIICKVCNVSSENGSHVEIR